MSGRARLVVFAVAAVGFAPLLLWGVLELPPFGHYQGPYGDVLNRVAVPERHVTDVVAAVNFDYRGIDTIGEEFILFAAVAGVVALLRTERDRGGLPGAGRPERAPGDLHRRARAPDARRRFPGGCGARGRVRVRLSGRPLPNLPARHAY
jgi:multicomponent Na+:H+ antiporter subunit B